MAATFNGKLPWFGGFVVLVPVRSFSVAKIAQASPDLIFITADSPYLQISSSIFPSMAHRIVSGHFRNRYIGGTFHI